jgi:hypothetical protein
MVGAAEFKKRDRVLAVGGVAVVAMLTVAFLVGVVVRERVGKPLPQSRPGAGQMGEAVYPALVSR